jgi:transcriptional regulator with XRE-family HTH domain
MKSTTKKRGPSSAATGTMRSFASRLRVIRERRKLTQKELAQLLPAETALISRYERGLNVPSASTIVELARILQVTTDELLTGTAEPPETPAIQNATLFERFRQLDAEIEDRRELETIVSLLDAFLAKKRMQKVLSA